MRRGCKVLILSGFWDEIDKSAIEMQCIAASGADGDTRGR